MKKKIANAVELVLLIVSIITLSVKTMTIMTTTPTEFTYAFEASAIDCMNDYTLQFVPMCVLYLICIVMCILSIATKSKYKDGKAHGFVALLLFIVANYNLISCTAGDEIVSNGFPGALFEGALFLAVVVAFAKRASFIAGVSEAKEVKQTVINNIQETTNADEIKKYKDLLDSGAITQEEFDEKKKQLLGL